MHATTILAVRHHDRAVLAGDGQVTLGNTVVKHGARKIRRLYNDSVLAGFAGSAADSFALFSRFEAKLEQYRGNLERAAVELARDWRTDRVLRRLEAMLVVLDARHMFLLSGTGDLIEPDDGIIGIGRAAPSPGRGHGARPAQRARRPGDRRAGDGHRRRDLHLHEQPPHDRRTVLRRARTLRPRRSPAGPAPRGADAPHQASPMSIPLPERTTTAVDALTPRQIVAELDRYVVGQGKAKRAVAIALRNRMRRQKLPAELADEVAPKNILMIGPTGVGKTEIARRLARLAQSPFLKVEASKFTEVGYVGRDVESMVRDLVEVAVDMVRSEQLEQGARPGRAHAEERLLDLLLPPRPPPAGEDPARGADEIVGDAARRCASRCAPGALDERVVEIEVQRHAHAVVRDHRRPGGRGDGREPQGHAARAVRRPHAQAAQADGPRGAQLLRAEEEQKLVDLDAVSQPAVDRGSSRPGIIFVDEIDKIAGREGGHGPDVTREGVQRDILPIVEGTTVNTKYGMVRTDHVLFIAAGAFHVSKPSDLIPELQGRFPIRVELEALGQEDFVRILTEPRDALVRAVPRAAGHRGRRR